VISVDALLVSAFHENLDLLASKSFQEDWFVSIYQEYRVLVSDQLVGDGTYPYRLSILKGKRIILPEARNRWPDQVNLEWHRTTKFLK